jgi:hypothetical protein
MQSMAQQLKYTYLVNSHNVGDAKALINQGAIENSASSVRFPVIVAFFRVEPDYARPQYAKRTKPTQ